MRRRFGDMCVAVLACRRFDQLPHIPYEIWYLSCIDCPFSLAASALPSPPPKKGKGVDQLINATATTLDQWMSELVSEPSAFDLKAHVFGRHL